MGPGEAEQEVGTEVHGQEQEEDKGEGRDKEEENKCPKNLGENQEYRHSFPCCTACVHSTQCNALLV